MGGYRADSDAHAIQTLQFPKLALFGAPAFWEGHAYVVAGDDVLRDFALRDGQLQLAHAAALPKYPDAGATPVVSSNGAQDGIVWAISTFNWQRSGPPAVLHAYNAADISEQNSARDHAGQALRFTAPLVVNGRVYVGTRGELDVYGLLP
jgi:hypothetical protein